MLISKLLSRLVNDLNQIDLEYALVGGLAVSAHVRPRTTVDVDIAVASENDEHSEHLTRAFVERGYGIVQVFEHTKNQRLSTVRLSAPEASKQSPAINLLFASSGIENEVVNSAITREVLGISLKIASISALIALKTLSKDDEARPVDKDDLRHLVAVASKKDIAHAKKLLRLITKRGFNRDKDLMSLFAELIET